MTLLLVEGFEAYSTLADLNKKYATETAATPPRCVEAASRNVGGKGLEFTNGGSLTIRMDAERSFFILGFALRLSAIYTGSLLYLDGATYGEGLINIDSGGHFTYSRRQGVGWTLLGTSTDALSPNQWYYIEFKFTWSDTAPIDSVQIKVNGSVWLTNAALWDTRNVSVAGVNILRFNPNGVVTAHIDDLYLCDDVDATAIQGAAFNNFLGDKKVVGILPSAVGTYSQGTPTGAATAHEATDDAAPDDDTSYQKIITSEKFTVNLQNIVGSGNILAYQIDALARKDGIGYRKIQLLERHGVTDRNDADKYLNDNYRYHSVVRGTLPGGATLNVENMNALEVGMEAIA